MEKVEKSALDGVAASTLDEAKSFPKLDPSISLILIAPVFALYSVKESYVDVIIESPSISIPKTDSQFAAAASSALIKLSGIIGVERTPFESVCPEPHFPAYVPVPLKRHYNHLELHLEHLDQRP